MQTASSAYKNSMKGMLRNRGYIRASLGVINSEATENVSADSTKNSFTYFSNAIAPFKENAVERIYATAEENFSVVDGTMYFLPEENSGYDFYNNGIVTEEILGKVYITFGTDTTYNLSGLEIVFGDCYPTEFTIQSDNATYSYTNNSSDFMTDDNFDGITYLIITPISMVGGNDRMRIYQLSCGVTNVFSNNEVLSFSSKEYVSSITDSVPSMDVTLKVDNQDLYYSPDNAESTLAYFEIGQKLEIRFGYDVLGDGNIEWLPKSTYHIKTWKADETQATFTATDRFATMDDTYYGGMYRPEGISLYDLAIDVLKDAGITDTDEFWVDPYLKNIVVYNPLEPVTHPEALEIIANAGRCILYEDRNGKISIKSSFIPDVSASCNGETEYSHIENVIVDDDKEAYAIESNDFSAVDENIYFMPDNDDYRNTGYISSEIADADGNFEINPVVALELESGYIAYSPAITFRNVAPLEFVVATYYLGELVETITITEPGLECTMAEMLDTFDYMTIEFTKGYPNARVTVDNITIGETTNYTLTRNECLTSSPTATRETTTKSISIVKTNYTESSEEISQLQSGEITLTADDPTYTVYFTNASYGLEATVEEDGVSVKITDSSNYFATLTFTGITEDTTINYSVNGYEYNVSESYYTVKHNDSGDAIEWSNPLVSTDAHASDLQEWLASYYLGQVSYELSWRGDPRVDANDLFYLELKDGSQTLIRSYQNELSFSGAWSGKIKARRAVV